MSYSGYVVTVLLIASLTWVLELSLLILTFCLVNIPGSHAKVYSQPYTDCLQAAN